MSNQSLKSDPESDRQDLHREISRIEQKVAKRFEEKDQKDKRSDRPSGLDRVFGKSGKIVPFLSPKHLLHTLPPDYPLSMAIDFLLKFLDELQNCLRTELQSLNRLEMEMVEILTPLSRMEKQLRTLKKEQSEAFFKFRYNKSITELEGQVATENRKLEIQVRHKKEITDQIDTIKHDLQQYQLRTAELIQQYFQELITIPADQLELYLNHSELAELHQRIIKASETQV